MKIVLDGIDGARDRPVARLRVVSRGTLVGRIDLPVEETAADVPAVEERLRDFLDLLVEWTRRGTSLAATPEGEQANDASRPAPP